MPFSSALAAKARISSACTLPVDPGRAAADAVAAANARSESPLRQSPSCSPMSSRSCSTTHVRASAPPGPELSLSPGVSPKLAQILATAASSVAPVTAGAVRGTQSNQTAPAREARTLSGSTWFLSPEAGRCTVTTSSPASSEGMSLVSTPPTTCLAPFAASGPASTPLKKTCGKKALTWLSNQSTGWWSRPAMRGITCTALVCPCTVAPAGTATNLPRVSPSTAFRRKAQPLRRATMSTSLFPDGHVGEPPTLSAPGSASTMRCMTVSISPAPVTVPPSPAAPTETIIAAHAARVTRGMSRTRSVGATRPPSR